MVVKYFVLLILVALAAAVYAADPLYITEGALVSLLLSNYDKEIRPQVEAKIPVRIQIKFTPVAVLDINEREGYMSTSLMPQLTWTDERLKWKGNDTYKDLKRISIPASRLWIPDIEVLNSMRSGDSNSLLSPNIVVDENGTVDYVPHIVVRTPCQFNLLFFPYDSHTCHILFGSWSFPTSQVSISPATEMPVDLEYLGEHADWVLKSIDVSVTNTYYPKFNDYYSLLVITSNIQRQGSFYYRLFVYPAEVMMFLVPIIHFAPTHSNERLTIGGLILVAVTVMYDMVEDFFPAFSAAQVPVILRYYTNLLMVVFLSLIVSCFSLMLGSGPNKTKRVPRVLRMCLFDKLGYLCCTRGRNAKYDYELLNLERSLHFSADSHQEGGDMDAIIERPGETGTTEPPTLPESTNQDSGVKEILKTLIDEMQFTRYKALVRAEWDQLAVILDRLTGLGLFILAVIMTATLFTSFK